MMTASISMFLWMTAALAVGFFGFFLVILIIVLRAARWVGQTLLGRKSAQHLEPTKPASRRLCRNPRCGHVNDETARYCARCGGPL